MLAPAASAENLRMYTCEKLGRGHPFRDADCTLSGSGGEYDHVLVAKNTTTYHGISNASTCAGESACPLTIKGTVSGVVLSVQAAKVSGSGTIVTEEAAGETFTTGTETLSLEEAKVTAPAGKGCVVKGGEIVTKELKMTTLGTGSLIKFEPASGTVLAEVPIEGCSVSALNNVFSLTGSFKGSPGGSIVTTTHAQITEQNTLKLGGVKAGLEAALTTSGKDWFFEPWTPLAFTFGP